MAALDFSAYIAERTRDFTGREWVFAEIDRWLATPGAPRFFVVTGEPGIGKTAIAARLTQVRQLAAYHFCMARQAQTLDPLTFARSVSEQLARVDEFARCLLAEKGMHVEVKIEVQENYGQIIGVQINNLTVDAPSATVAFNRAVLDPLRRLYAGGHRGQIVVLIDALDEAVQHIGAETIVAVLANIGGLPEGVRFLLTSRPEGAALRHFQERGIPHLVLDAGREENQADVRAYVRARRAASAELQARVAEAGLGAFVERLSAASKGNFLYVVWVLRAVAEGIQGVDRPDELPIGLDGIYREFLRTRKVGEDVDRWRSYRPVFGVLAVAREPLSTEQVARFAGLDAQATDDVLQDAQQFLSGQLNPTGTRYQLYHQSLANFLSDKDRAGEFWIDIDAFHWQIADDYAARCKDDWGQCEGYGLRHLPAHLAAAGEGARLRALLLNFDWLQAKLDATDTNALIGDYDLVTDSDLRLVQSALRLSAHVLVHDPRQLAGQLLGRLLSFKESAITALLLQVQQWRGAAWLRPLTASLMPPGGALVRTLAEGMGALNAAAITPDGLRVILGTQDGRLAMWDVLTGEAVRVFSDEGAPILTVGITPNADKVVSASADNMIRVWNPVDGKLLSTILVEGVVDVLSGVTGSSELIAGMRDGSLGLWSLAGGTMQRALKGHLAWINSVIILREGRYAVSASADKTIRVWNLESGRQVRVFRSHDSAVVALAATHDEQLLLTGSRDGSLACWNLDTGENMYETKAHTGTINAIAVTSDGKQVVTASHDKTIALWDLRNGSVLQEFAGHTGPVMWVGLAVGGKYIVSASRDGTSKVWARVAGLDAPVMAHRQRSGVTVLVMSGREYKASAAAEDGTVKAWDIDTGKLLWKVDRCSGIVGSLGLLLKAQLLVGGTRDGKLVLWDWNTGALLDVRHGHEASITGLAVLPTERLIVSASSDGALKLWRFDRGPKLRKYESFLGHRGVINSIMLSANGKRIVSASGDGTVRIWDVAARRLVHTLGGHDGPVNAVAMTPDLEYEVSASDDGTLRIWYRSWPTYKLVGHEGPVTCVLVSRDCRLVISGGEDGTVRLWPLLRDHVAQPYSVRAKRIIQEHGSAITALLLSVDSRSLISASRDGMVRLWNLTRDRTVSTFRADAAVLTLAATPDCMRIVAGDQMGQIHFLRVQRSQSSVGEAPAESAGELWRDT